MENKISIRLTKRELEALENLVLSGSVKGAAKALNISTRTMESYVEHIKTKLGLQYKYQLNKINIENFYQRKN
ncbi:LuxR C-terminal-related transcriptional regulator [Candidatus Tisiphia endosymbiont of Oplodontha viridula]|uniref:LuxR C-terminal-related transcriptional regulator n=1 Tax=Candidatus Tisiphia endosymbiont of Oplodontha viridula TaxID=3077925 RepID=UPI0035C9153B